MSKNIFLTGGAGYCGSKLVPILLEMGHQVSVYDILYFGSDFLPLNNKNLKLIQGDIRDNKKIEISCQGHDVFINLACISNDASFVLDEKLSTSVNLDAFEPMVLAAKKAGIKRFIYASSSSVYGVSNKKDVKEDHPLVPLTLYNKYKGMCEPLLFKHTNDSFEGVIFRPATVCGYAPRLRLDLSVNILTNHAVNNNKITVFGGSQYRPNLTLIDMINVYHFFIKKNYSGTFNVGFENEKVIDIAIKIKKKIKKIKIYKRKSNDVRSYRLDSSKLLLKGYKKISSIENEINNLKKYFLSKNFIFSNNMIRIKYLKKVLSKKN
jgi:nucleoside-diphosphate-sugar epimerase